ncbi:MAG: hypothetical protein E7259_05750 [Lachnospiraceae bacterium]|nr:hypothetical protein [Lachnospiraceae bacterium]
MALRSSNLSDEKGKIYYAVPVLIIVVVFVAYFFGWEIGAYMNKDSTAYNLVELTNMINDQIDSGKSSGTFYVKGVTEEEINQINDYICSLNGVVERYAVTDKIRGGMKVKFVYDISDNYYVYRKYVYGEGIPSDRPAAKKLYDEVVLILKTIIAPNMTDYEKELAIHDYIVANCQYGFVEHSKEYAFCAYGALVQKTAVCNGYAEAMALLLNCVGIENDIMTGWGNDVLHAWNRVKLDGNWYHVDATWDDPLPDKGSFVSHMYFNVTDDVMDNEHEWEDGDYEPCESDDYNYFEVNNSVGDYVSFKNKVTFEASRNSNGIVEVVATDYSEDAYDMGFIFEIPGIESYQLGILEYGDDHVITIYLNQKE